MSNTKTEISDQVPPPRGRLASEGCTPPALADERVAGDRIGRFQRGDPVALREAFGRYAGLSNLPAVLNDTCPTTSSFWVCRSFPSRREIAQAWSEPVGPVCPAAVRISLGRIVGQHRARTIARRSADRASLRAAAACRGAGRTRARRVARPTPVPRPVRAAGEAARSVRSAMRRFAAGEYPKREPRTRSRRQPPPWLRQNDDRRLACRAGGGAAIFGLSIGRHRNSGKHLW